MTAYTKRRRYPYPDSAREAANGGLASELLARAVARDLDTLDAGWAAEMQHSTVILTLGTAVSGIPTLSNWPIFMDTVNAASTGVGLKSTGASGLSVLPGGDGLYHCFLSARAQASGAITASCWHRLIATVTSVTPTGVVYTREEYYYETQQVGTQDIFTQLEFTTILRQKDSVSMYYLHTNAASSVIVQNTMTRMAALKIMAV